MDEEKLIEQALTRGVDNIYPSRAEFEKRLRSGKKLRLYVGFDPTSVSMQIGNAVQIMKLAQFQKLGHEVIFLIGDFTGMIGDPTDKSETRPKLAREQVLKNSANYKAQASKILNFSGKNAAKVMYNSEWNDKVSFKDLIELTSNFTVGQLIIRDMFQKRLKDKKPIYLHEFLYPVAQAYDSVAMDVDLEIGGSDQMFNMLCGRDLMMAVKKKEKFVLTTKLLADPKGAKMSKTGGNMVRLDEEPNQMFGQIMSWPDGLIIPGLELCTDVDMAEIYQTEQDMKAGKINPRDAKAKLAREIVAIHHSKSAAGKAEAEFDRVFKAKDAPTKMPVFKAGKDKYILIDLLVETKLAPSKSEAKRLVEQGGIKIQDKKISSWQQEIKVRDKMVVQAGKRKFVQVRI